MGLQALVEYILAWFVLASAHASRLGRDTRHRLHVDEEHRRQHVGGDRAAGDHIRCADLRLIRTGPLPDDESANTQRFQDPVAGPALLLQAPLAGTGAVRAGLWPGADYSPDLTGGAAA